MIKNGSEKILKNWNFEGSTDGGNTWQILSKHENENTSSSLKSDEPKESEKVCET